jgi:hypothetical protein
MRPVAQPCLAGSPHLYSRAYEWSAGLALHCSSLSTHLIGHNDATCLHVLQASMALTRTPWNYVIAPWNHMGVPFFIPMSCGP